MLTVRKALKKTQDFYGVRGKDLAELAGIGVPHLSQIRSEKSWPSEEVLMQLLGAMESLAPGSRLHFCTLLAGLQVTPAVKELEFEEMGDEELGAFVVRASDELAKRLLAKSRKNTLVSDRVKVKAG